MSLFSFAAFDKSPKSSVSAQGAAGTPYPYVILAPRRPSYFPARLAVEERVCVGLARAFFPPISAD